jgi:hypothetical protein
VVIDHHLDVQGFFDFRSLTGDVQQDAVGMSAGYHQTVLVSELDQRLIILLCGTEFRRELLRAQVMSEIRARRVLELCQQSIEFILIPQRQSYREV